MSKILLLCAFFLTGFFGQSYGQKIFQSPRITADGKLNIKDWDGSEILNEKGEILSTISIKNGKIDFSRKAGQSRIELLAFLYKEGVRGVYTFNKEGLVINPDGHIGPDIHQDGFFQALQETETGYSLNSFQNSTIIDAKGTVLARVVIRDKKATLSLAPGQTLESLWRNNMFFFYYKPGKGVNIGSDGHDKIILKE